MYQINALNPKDEGHQARKRFGQNFSTATEGNKIVLPSSRKKKLTDTGED